MMMTTTEPMKLTERHVIDKATIILAEARRLGYFMFKCHIVSGNGSYPLLLSFANGGDTKYERQLGWARFFEKSGGLEVSRDVAYRFHGVVESFILSSDGIESWRTGIAVRRRNRG